MPRRRCTERSRSRLKVGNCEYEKNIRAPSGHNLTASQTFSNRLIFYRIIDTDLVELSCAPMGHILSFFFDATDLLPRWGIDIVCHSITGLSDQSITDHPITASLITDHP